MQKSLLTTAQNHLREQGIDAWLVYDYAGNNPTLQTFLGVSSREGGRHLLLIPAQGEPRLLVHVLDQLDFASLDLEIDTFASWQDIQAWLRQHIAQLKKVAMEYSPLGELPAISTVDAGTLELIRSFGPTVVSSADLFQLTCCAWTPAQLASHMQAAKHLEEVKDLAFAMIRTAMQAGAPITEYDVQQMIMNEFDRRGLDTDGAPAIVAAGANSRFPHYMPSAEQYDVIKPDQLVLIDIWAKPKGPDGTYADITWMGYTGTEVPELENSIFQIVRTARDRVTDALTEAWKQGQTVQGWQLDRAARDYIEEQGYGAQFVHTTGHSLGEEVHAPGVGLNDLSAHDTRTVVPGIGLTVEPGIYIEQFGVRLELDVYIDPVEGPRITTPPQTDLVILA